MYVSVVFFWTVVCLHASFGNADVADPKSPVDDAGPQLESKRGNWDKNLKMWGKRNWQSLHGGWGLKRDAATPWEGEDKRAWQNLQGAWGKRTATEDEQAIKDLADWLEQREVDQQQIPDDYDADFSRDLEKRAWKQFGGGWGKRGAETWKNFRGSWGKREPAWNNLKGIWGKRSAPDGFLE